MVPVSFCYPSAGSRFAPSPRPVLGGLPQGLNLSHSDIPSLKCLLPYSLCLCLVKDFLDSDPRSMSPESCFDRRNKGGSGV